MKNYKHFFAGAIVGGVLLSGGNVLANNASLPSITNWVKYKFNDEEKTLPMGYTTLNYDGHTYVPARFIAEELGAEVEWDDKTKTVSIEKKIETDDTSKEDQSESIEVEDETEQQEPSQEQTKVYEELPVSKTINGVRVEVYSVEQDYEYTKMYVIVKNTTESLVQLNQESAYFKSENEKYEHKSMKGNVLYWKDIAWFNDIKEDDEVEGYVMLPRIPENENQGEFYIEVIENAQEPEIYKYKFDMKW